MQQYNTQQKDLELASACAKGDRRAQHALFERVKKTMFGVCLRFANNRPEAEDLLQEGFIRVFRDIGRFRGDGSLDGWVRRVFVRTCIEYFHRSKNLPEMIELDLLDDYTIDIPEEFDPENPDSALVLLQKLPPGFRTVLNLAVLEEKSHEEIARALGIATSTSRSQLARAKEFLKKIIQKTLVLI